MAIEIVHLSINSMVVIFHSYICNRLPDGKSPSNTIKPPLTTIKPGRVNIDVLGMLMFNTWSSGSSSNVDLLGLVGTDVAEIWGKAIEIVDFPMKNGDFP